MRLSRCIVILAIALFTTVSPLPSSSEPLRFVALGDMPYGDWEEDILKRIGGAIREARYPFVVHYGDVLLGKGPCPRKLLEERKELIYGLHPSAVFYTPGDNEWADCEFVKDKHGNRIPNNEKSEVQRLEDIREIFFSPADLPMSDKWEIARQAPDFPENAHWSVDGVVFVTLHVIGTRNGRDHIVSSLDGSTPSKGNLKQEALKAVDDRDKANTDWLVHAFARAHQQNAVAIVVFMQANPHHPNDQEWQGKPPCDEKRQEDCDPFAKLVGALVGATKAFNRPVLLVHGDTDEFCLDRKYGGQAAPTLWRLDGPGDDGPKDAAVVTVDTNAHKPFDVQLLLSGRPPDGNC